MTKKIKIGFSLAEVLITLGIIGVVAAILLPILMAKYNEKVLLYQFKKSYSLLSAAFRKIEVNNDGSFPDCYLWETSPYPSGTAGFCIEYNDDGSCKSWAPQPSDYYGPTSQCSIIQDEFEKVVQIAKKCENKAYEQGCIPVYNGIEKVVKEKNPNITDSELNKKISGGAWWKTDSIANDRTAYVLADGTIILLSGWSGMRVFAIDVNGHKAPNKWGHDLFIFNLRGMPGAQVRLKQDTLVILSEKNGKSTLEMMRQ